MTTTEPIAARGWGYWEALEGPGQKSILYIADLGGALRQRDASALMMLINIRPKPAKREFGVMFRAGSVENQGS